MGGEHLIRSAANVYFTSSNITRFHPTRADKGRTMVFKEVLMTKNTTAAPRDSWLARNLHKRKLYTSTVPTIHQEHRRRLFTSTVSVRLDQDHNRPEACYLVAACCYSSLLATFLIMNISLYLATFA